MRPDRVVVTLPLLDHDHCTLRFIERGENAVLLDPSSVGKTHLAIAIA